jgi:type IV secretion system protein VirB9
MKSFALLILWVASGLGAQAIPPPIADPRVRTITYDAGQVYRFGVAQRYQLTLVFDPDEQVENVALGDSESWQVTLNGRGDALFIKPLRSSGPTNMTVITDRRLYSFELSQIGGLAPDTPFTVRFKGAAETAASPQPTPVVSARYRLSGARALRPSSVTDDTQQTTIDWGANQALPAVFTIDDEGQETLANGQMRDGRYVIAGVYRTLVFRLDGQTARAERRVQRGRR